MSISKAEKAAYNDEIKDIKNKVEDVNTEIKNLILKQRKLPNITDYYTIEIVNNQLQIIDLYLKMNSVSLDMLGIKNETFLNNARKGFYKVLQDMENLLGKEVDRSLKENDKYLMKIGKLNPQQIYQFINKIHGVFRELKFGVGEGSKWKWSFVELQARVAVITKNITSFSDIAKFRDPRSEFYSDRTHLMNLSKESLAEAAKQFRTKYELSGKARDDLKASIELLAALRRIHIIFGENEDAEKLRNTIEAAKQTLEAVDEKGKKKKK